MDKPKDDTQNLPDSCFTVVLDVDAIAYYKGAVLTRVEALKLLSQTVRRERPTLD